jgi:peptidylprolyl isomerase
MKRIALLFLLATPAVLYNAVAQTPATTSPKPATAAAKPAVGTAAKKPGTAAATGIKLPPGVPPVKGVLKTAFSLRYQDVKLGAGALAEPGKLYKVHYTGWLAADGKKFDSSYDHRRPELDKDGKPVNDADGKPKLNDPEPIQFPQGRRGVIPGWDQGFGGMKIGGKRRLFIPYQLAYGELGRPPVIPPKSDLIFDIELIDVTDMPAQGQQRMPPGRPMPPKPGTAPGTPAPASPAPPAPPAGTAAPAAPTTAPSPAPSATPAPTTPQPAQPTPPPANTTKPN